MDVYVNVNDVHKTIWCWSENQFFFVYFEIAYVISKRGVSCLCTFCYL